MKLTRLFVEVASRRSLLLEGDSLPRISKQEAVDRGMFGPVYHGTTEDSRQSFLKKGFEIYVGQAGEGPTRHGFQSGLWGGGNPIWPVHFLGYGIYFTTVKSIAKKFDAGSRTLKYEFYLDVPRMEVINFASPKKMMDWWVRQGFDPELAKTDQVEATKKMTEALKQKYDAVWFKGKGLYHLMDGDQVCVFDTSRIYLADPSLSTGTDAGAMVRRKFDGMPGVILGKRPFLGGNTHQGNMDHLEKLLQDPALTADLDEERKERLRQSLERSRAAVAAGAEEAYFSVRWKRGGTEGNVYSSEFEPVSAPIRRS
jgi:hypothetical protein